MATGYSVEDISLDKTSKSSVPNFRMTDHPTIASGEDRTVTRGTFLHPLSFPEAQETDLSHFIDQDRDIPIVCLIPSCNEVFGVGPSAKVTVEVDYVSVKEPKEMRNRRVKVESKDVSGSKEVAPGNDTSEDLSFKGSSAENMTDFVDASCRQKEVVDVETTTQEFSVKDRWLRHLFLVHKLVIDEVENICSLRR